MCCSTRREQCDRQFAKPSLAPSQSVLSSCRMRSGPLRRSEVTVHGPEGRGTAIWRVSPPPTPPHNVADLSGFVTARSFAATLRGGGHATPRER
jgi:hypothetical protein